MNSRWLIENGTPNHQAIPSFSFTYVLKLREKNFNSHFLKTPN